MTAQRLTTFTSRCLMGMSGAFLSHGLFISYFPFGFGLHLGTLLIALSIFFLSEYSRSDDSSQEKRRESQSRWSQSQAFWVGILSIIGGALAWAV